jgi:hypothetical protein
MLTRIVRGDDCQPSGQPLAKVRELAVSTLHKRHGFAISGEIVIHESGELENALAQELVLAAAMLGSTSSFGACRLTRLMTTQSRENRRMISIQRVSGDFGEPAQLDDRDAR